MASAGETAEFMLRIYARANSEHRKIFLTYKEMAVSLGRPGQQNILQQALDTARVLCREREVPEFPVMIVSENSVKAGTLLPADGAFDKYGGLAGIRRLQAEVIAFDWSSVRDI